MADANPKVMEMIEAELKKNPDVSNADLFEKAKKVDKGVGSLSPRQFNAMYPLQVKRSLKPRKRRSRKAKPSSKPKSKPKSKSKSKSKSGRTGRGRSGAGGGDRERVRSVLLELARDIANAQGKGDVVDVVAGIDRYVDRVIRAG